MKRENRDQRNLFYHNINGENFYKESDLKEYISNLFDQFTESITKTFKEQFEYQEELLTPEEAAKFLKCSPETIHNWKKSGKLNYYRIGGRIYFKKSEIINSLKGSF